MHNGHRERIRKRIAEHGLESLNDYEFLEFLLYCAQPRVNTNEQAHRLLDTFGSVSAVLDSDVSDLMEIEGIGSAAAQFLTLIPGICRRYYGEKYTPKAGFHSIEEIVVYLQRLYVDAKEETASLLLLGADLSPICLKTLARGNARQVYIDRQEILVEVARKKASYVVLAHNHPTNMARPSSEDLVLTNHLKTALEVTGSRLLDHIILCPDGAFYSFAMSDQL